MTIRARRTEAPRNTAMTMAVMAPGPRTPAEGKDNTPVRSESAQAAFLLISAFSCSTSVGLYIVGIFHNEQASRNAPNTLGTKVRMF